MARLPTNCIVSQAKFENDPDAHFSQAQSFLFEVFHEVCHGQSAIPQAMYVIGQPPRQLFPLDAFIHSVFADIFENQYSQSARWFDALVESLRNHGRAIRSKDCGVTEELARQLQLREQDLSKWTPLDSLVKPCEAARDVALEFLSGYANAHTGYSIYAFCHPDRTGLYAELDREEDAIGIHFDRRMEFVPYFARTQIFLHEFLHLLSSGFRQGCLPPSVDTKTGLSECRGETDPFDHGWMLFIEKLLVTPKLCPCECKGSADFISSRTQTAQLCFEYAEAQEFDILLREVPDLILQVSRAILLHPCMQRVDLFKAFKQCFRADRKGFIENLKKSVPITPDSIDALLR